MEDTSQVALRMRDVTLALGAAQQYEQTLSKIALQKFIYLLDVVAILYDLYPSADGHVTYTYGPYDSTIQSAVDSLAFRGFVSIVASRTHAGGVSADYALTAAGDGWLEDLRSQSAFTLRWAAAADIAERVNSLGWSRLVELVYAEPTFVQERAKGLGRRLLPAGAADETASSLLRYIRYALSPTVPSRAVLVDLFFRYLHEYAGRTLGTHELRPC